MSQRFTLVMLILDDVRLLLKCAVQLDYQDFSCPADNARAEQHAQSNRDHVAKAYARIQANLEQLLELCAK